MHQESKDVIVVGGGASGFAAALAAAQAGYETALFAPVHEPSSGRTAALLAGSIDLLAALGVWDAIAPASAALRMMRIVDATGGLFTAPELDFDAKEIGLDEFGRNIPNADLVAGLKDVAAATQKLAVNEAFVERIEFGRDGVTVDAGATVAAKLLVGADGRGSVVREAAGIGKRSWSYPQKALVTILEHEADHENASTEFHTRSGPFTLVPLPGRRSSLVWMDRPDVIDGALDLDDRAFGGLVTEKADYLLGAMHPATERAAYPMSGLIAQTSASDRCVLVGEAAHAFPPIGAQGLNLGFRDVSALRTVLEAHPTDPGGSAVLETYRRRRRGDIVSRTLGVDALNRSLLVEFLPIQAARALAMATADRWPPLRRALMRAGLQA